MFWRYWKYIACVLSGIIVFTFPVLPLRAEETSQQIDHKLTQLLQQLGIETESERQQFYQIQGLTSYMMGVIFDLYGQTEDAIRAFQRSAQFEDSYAAHLRLGADYARMGLLDEAVDHLQNVLDVDENNVQARYLLALIYSTQKNFDLAAQEYETILTSFSEANPDNIEIYGYLGQLYYSQNDYPKAIDQFETMLSLEPDNADTMTLLGALYLETGKMQRAIELFARALEVDPDHDTCLNSLGYIYAEEGKNLDEAQKLIERALRIDPDNGAYMDSLGWVYFKKGDYDQALHYLFKARSLLEDPVIYEHLGDVYYKMDRKEDARKYWLLSLELSPEQNDLRDKVRSLNLE